MKKFIYHSVSIRCKIRYIKYLGHFELQIQERFFLLFWINVYKWMTIREGFWGESDQHPILRCTYENGNNSEAWMTGTLDIENRVRDFFKEYFFEKNREESNIERVKNLLKG